MKYRKVFIYSYYMVMFGWVLFMLLATIGSNFFSPIVNVLIILIGVYSCVSGLFILREKAKDYDLFNKMDELDKIKEELLESKRAYEKATDNFLKLTQKDL